MALGITKSFRIGERDVTHNAPSHAVQNTLTRSCHTADRTITPGHVPRLHDLDDQDLHTQLTQVVPPFARKAEGRPPAPRPRRGPLRPRPLPEELVPHRPED
ncbi:hypothetical protein QFZ67_007546 [Streptomyces sp. V1I1]|nr:hypothetical protein [Streptomyces sp. V1I1]